MHHIAYITDDSYAVATMASINSLVRNIGDGQFAVHVVAIDLSSQNAAAMTSLESRNVRVDVVEVENEFKEFRGIHSYISEAALFKFRLGTIFKDIGRLLYLDCDTLVYPGVADIFNTDISGVYAAVVADMPAMCQRQSHNQFGLARYFNSGVMYLNLEKMRAERLADKLEERWRADVNIGLDQDVLNVVFRENVKWLGLRYNCFATYKDRFSLEEIKSFFGADEDELRHPAIIHITGRFKPWNDWSSGVFDEWARFAPAGAVARMARDRISALEQRLANLERQHEGLARAHAALDAAHAELNARAVDQERRLAALENNFFVRNAMRLCRALRKSGSNPSTSWFSNRCKSNSPQTP